MQARMQYRYSTGAQARPHAALVHAHYAVDTQLHQYYRNTEHSCTAEVHGYYQIASSYLASARRITALLSLDLDPHAATRRQLGVLDFHYAFSRFF